MIYPFWLGSVHGARSLEDQCPAMYPVPSLQIWPLRRGDSTIPLGESAYDNSQTGKNRKGYATSRAGAGPANGQSIWGWDALCIVATETIHNHPHSL